MKVNILTLFPEFFYPYLEFGIIKRALDSGQVEIQIENIRDFSQDKHHKADDYLYGGGYGMLMTPQPLWDALEGKKRVYYLTPRGEPLTQSLARELVAEEVTLLCGHYEGIDQRIIDARVEREISIGDYILSGGEIGALVLLDVLLRVTEGVIEEGSTLEESHENGLLEYHQYTRPVVFKDMEVPEILLSGHHENIRQYRLKESVKLTLERRPDLIEKGLQNNTFSDEIKKLIHNYREEKSI